MSSVYTDESPEKLVREYRSLLREGMKALPKETGKKKEKQKKKRR